MPMPDIFASLVKEIDTRIAAATAAIEKRAEISALLVLRDAIDAKITALETAP